MNANDDLESKINAKRLELEEAQDIVQKYAAIVPLSVSVQPVGHNANEVKIDGSCEELGQGSEKT